MKKKRWLLIGAVLAALILIAVCIPTYALTAEEAEQQIATQGKEAVAGNVLIWFLCAVAFLKVSQKIDSFMSSLGINVGRTGGSMLAEAMIAGRAITKGFGGLAGSGSGGFRNSRNTAQ